MDNDKIESFEDLEKRLNLALKSRLLPGIKKGHLKLAIDLNLIPALPAFWGNLYILLQKF